MSTGRRVGIRPRHSRTCRRHSGGKCSCKPTYEAAVFSVRDGKKIRRTFPTEAAARRWRTDALHALSRGTLRAPAQTSLREEAMAWLDGAKAGRILTRSQRPYKPAVLRGIEANLVRFVLPELGGRRACQVTRRDLQALIDGLQGDGLSGSSVRNVIVALKVIYRRMLEDDTITVNPTTALRLPPPAGVRDRAASAAEVDALLDALPDEDRALWTTAAYAGLRRGELRGLRWEDVDLGANVIHVKRGWDEREGAIEPKSAKGARRVPIVAPLRRVLLEHKAATGRRDADLVFGRTPTEPFTPTNVRKRALAAWAAASVGTFLRGQRPAVELVPIGLHELRHSYVSMLHAAGFSLEEIGDYIGHTSAYMTDRYRHLLAGHEQRAAERFEQYLAAAGARNGAQLA